ncbi:MAG: hypothetical protein WD467_02705 [Candidatus Saccharimonadales bacterium]
MHEQFASSNDIEITASTAEITLDKAAVNRSAFLTAAEYNLRHTNPQLYTLCHEIARVLARGFAGPDTNPERAQAFLLGVYAGHEMVSAQFPANQSLFSQQAKAVKTEAPPLRLDYSMDGDELISQVDAILLDGQTSCEASLSAAYPIIESRECIVLGRELARYFPQFRAGIGLVAEAGLVGARRLYEDRLVAAESSDLDALDDPKMFNELFGSS